MSEIKPGDLVKVVIENADWCHYCKRSIAKKHIHYEVAKPR